MKKNILVILVLALSLPMGAQTIIWEAVPMDGSRTGTILPDADNALEALGTVRNGVYYAPNGKKYRGGATAKVAALMIEAQDSVAYMKEVIGYCPAVMEKARPESGLTNMIVDCMMSATEAAVGKHVDVGLMNLGGIRTAMPEGIVQLADIYAMLPFENYLCYVELKGYDLKALLTGIASHIQSVGGVRMEINGRKLQTLLVGGKAVENDKVYGLATVDFLLTGGDGISAAKNAQSLTVTDVLLRDAVLPYLKSLKAEGRQIEYKLDGRVVFLK